MNESGDDPAPPNVADSPPPLGDCSNTATPRMMQSMTRRTMMNVYIWRGVSVIGVSSEDYEAYAPRSSADDSRPDIHVETRAATSTPSISGAATSSAAFSAFTLPPYSTRKESV